MMRSSVRVWLVAVCLFAAIRISVAAEDSPAPQDQQKFLRFVEDQQGGARLESAIISFRDAAGITVDLVAAIHVAERKYYEDLNRTFATYDAVLYEMIKPRGTGAPAPGQPSHNLISAIQRFLRDVLELEFQLDAINYRAHNFVHADLHAEDFARLQAERGENMFTLMLRIILDELSSPHRPAREISLTELLVALTSPDRARHLKMILGRQFQDIELKVAGLEGPAGSVLISERNKAALAVLRQTIAKGNRKIAVFFGAAHMPDLSRRLREIGFHQAGIEWRVAWDMTPKEGDIIIRRVGKGATQPAR